MWHDALLAKLTAFGVGDTFTRFISSFLRDRSIRVVIDGVSSKEEKLMAGVPQGSVLSPSLFLIFINDLLDRTENPIYSFADDSTLCHSYSFDHRPSLQEIEGKRQVMHESLNRDLAAIVEWGRANRVDFNAGKTQCCLLSHKRAADPVESSLTFDGADVEESAALGILGMKIQSDARWADHVFGVAKDASKCLGFLKRCKKYFTPSDLLIIYTTYIRPRMEYNSHIWAGAPKSSLELLDRIQKRAKVLIGDNSITSTLAPLEHRRNVGCVTLFYRYFNGMCSSEIRELVPNIKIFARSTRLAGGSHRFTVDLPVVRTTHYRKNSFFSRTVRMWNELPASVFPATIDTQRFKENVNKHYTHYPPSPT